MGSEERKRKWSCYNYWRREEGGGALAPFPLVTIESNGSREMGFCEVMNFDRWAIPPPQCYVISFMLMLALIPFCPSSFAKKPLEILMQK